jgi:DNA-binding transcriptional ArsR family regulator
MSTFESVIQAAEREIRRDTEDLTRLKDRYPGYDFVLVDNVRPELSRVQVEILALIESSRDDIEWTSRKILTELAGRVSIAGNDDVQMNAVTLALTALRDARKIRRVHEGRGRDPHRYKALEKEVPSEEKAS